MNIFYIIRDLRELFKQGNALKVSGILANTEALASALYGMIGAAINLLNDFGIEFQFSHVDLHTMTNGWAISFSFFYAVYRVITNAAAGVPATTD